MKHAGTATLDQLEPLLAKLRELDGLTERKRGVFYLKSSAFIHFHEDPTGLYAHFKDGSNWRRLPVNTRGERSALIATLSANLGA
ncbi:MAG TPA: hypothetical protein VGY55_15990 [Pirellulales bacterium]|jgi:hypothetical protein|nr:hypothetical protein [Pirellulales bacterium]